MCFPFLFMGQHALDAPDSQFTVIMSCSFVNISYVGQVPFHCTFLRRYTIFGRLCSFTESYGISPQDTASLSTNTKGRRGRKPNQKVLKSDMKTKLERSRQSARECRARKKLRYQYLDDLLLEREKANLKLKEELLVYQKWCHELDKGRMPEQLPALLKSFAEELQQG